MPQTASWVEGKARDTWTQPPSSQKDGIIRRPLDQAEFSISPRPSAWPWGYLKISRISLGTSSSGFSQPASKYFSQSLAHGRP